MESLRKRFVDESIDCDVFADNVTLEIPAQHLLPICRALRDESVFKFGQLIDLCGVDYAQYGITNWNADTGSGSFSRGTIPDALADTPTGTGSRNTKKQIRGRFAVVYHLLSHSHNQRLRVRAYVQGDPPRIDSVVAIWNSANWFEREAFDLFGILFEGHPDLRRILTDYGFIGHPMRKDFSIAGTMETRYDAEKKRVVYQPVSIKPRTLVPRVIR
uniref:NADH-quinone oxidoreductase subunit C n=1 Tax=Candidatus Kentrum sp. FM TaxID=2126340 RepID=A0A450S0C5_9GAMM|nr:MAG: NADH-quinone oxidoreductase subunit C [Candidatus Kentron sp. FM]VFJ69267.1 MAG: NADH-quinone oxidoreductase subunit C [Candidatus Kentron sp. FM]VFK10073.1 MAG: NADH-quinone oxidoreductase subunit C [Candidatus Kentron sp. FM]